MDENWWYPIFRKPPYDWTITPTVFPHWNDGEFGESSPFRWPYDNGYFQVSGFIGIQPETMNESNINKNLGANSLIFEDVKMAMFKV